MSMNISGSGNTYNGINTNSKQYKALKEKGDEAGGGEFVDVGEGVVLDVLIHRVTQVDRKSTRLNSSHT